jgi:hypothetical protein
MDLKDIKTNILMLWDYIKLETTIFSEDCPKCNSALSPNIYHYDKYNRKFSGYKQCTKCSFKEKLI